MIDARGSFNLTKKGVASFTLVLDAKDAELIYELQRKFGGSIHSIANSYGIKYRLKTKKGIVILLHRINGLLLNSNRILQMDKLCKKYKVKHAVQREIVEDSA
jgi:hypothetical protein